jgi:hypothetical protein
MEPKSHPLNKKQLLPKLDGAVKLKLKELNKLTELLWNNPVKATTE